MADVWLRGVSKSFGDVAAIRDLNLHISDGEFVVLLGPTGAGKTTTLRLIAGLEKPEKGAIHIAGRDATPLAPAARDVAFVFQQYSLYPHLSVFENLAFPLRSPARKMARARDRAGASRRWPGWCASTTSSTTARRSCRAARCSAWRSAGRWCASRPIYLMDEPLSSLDAKLRAELRLELKRIQTELGATVLYVTHDQIEAMTMADRIGILADGVLVQVGTPKTIYTQPANLHVAARLGQPAINLLPVGLLPEAEAPTGTKTIGARTEHLTIAKSANGHADGTVDWVEHLGDQNHLHVTVKDKKLITLTDPDTPFRKGDQVTIKLRNPLFFDGAGNRIQGG